MEILKLYNKNNDPRNLQRVVDVLEDGGIIIYPTDTSYAIGCHAMRERAVERICKIKRLDPKRQSLSIICYDLSHVSTYARISTPIYKLMRKHLPGAFTFILPGLSKLPKVFQHRQEREIGIRMPDEPLLHELCTLLDAPLMTTSVPTTDLLPEEDLGSPELLAEAFATAVDLVIDGGIRPVEQSTIVRCTDDTPEIVRQGKGYLEY